MSQQDIFSSVEYFASVDGIISVPSAKHLITTTFAQIVIRIDLRCPGQSQFKDQRLVFYPLNLA